MGQDGARPALQRGAASAPPVKGGASAAPGSRGTADARVSTNTNATAPRSGADLRVPEIAKPTEKRPSTVEGRGYPSKAPAVSLPKRPSKFGDRHPALRVVAAIAYWAVVLAISLALVVALVLFLESRDASDIGAEPWDHAFARDALPEAPIAYRDVGSIRRAKTTTLWAAL